MCAKTLKEFLGVPLFKEITWLAWCICCYQHGVPFSQLQATLGSPACSHGSFQTPWVPPHHPFTSTASLQLPQLPFQWCWQGRHWACPHASRDTQCGYPPQWNVQQQGVWLPEYKDPEDAKVHTTMGMWRKTVKELKEWRRESQQTERKKRVKKVLRIYG